MKKKKLVVETNDAFIKGKEFYSFGVVDVMFPPPLSRDYWLFRVVLSHDQALVCFPKLGTYGIGFQREKEDWNTNMPYVCDAERIWEHIKINRGNGMIRKSACLKGIRLLQEAVKTMKAGVN